MMKLILCLTLTWLFPGTAEAQLDCLDERPGVSSVQTCDYSDDLCATLSVVSETMGGGRDQLTIRTCMESPDCTEADQVFSISEGGKVMVSSIKCCDTDLCNNHTTNIDIQTKNGLTCASCAHRQSPVCKNRISIECVGIQDRCIDANITDGNVDYQFLGCVSANICDVKREIQTALSNSLRFTGEPKCCNTDLCNSARTVTLSVAPLLLGLVALVVY